jgi:hypothetical protein
MNNLLFHYILFFIIAKAYAEIIKFDNKTLLSNSFDNYIRYKFKIAANNSNENKTLFEFNISLIYNGWHRVKYVRNDEEYSKFYIYLIENDVMPLREMIKNNGVQYYINIFTI